MDVGSTADEISDVNHELRSVTSEVPGYDHGKCSPSADGRYAFGIMWFSIGQVLNVAVTHKQW